jgi:hypothetical protein
MREFFCGWRRKIGVVTLALACLFTAGWVRSQTITDCFYASDVAYFVASDTTGFTLLLSDILIEHRQTPFDAMPVFTSAASRQKLLSESSIVQQTNCLVFKFGMYNWPNGLRMTFVTVPFPSIVIPLALASAWCLLTKPRTKAATKPEPSHA